MDNKTAKEILSAYRPNGTDALDEKFHEALQHAERDPEIKAWFEEQRSFDKEATTAMNAVEVPEEGKERLLSMLKMEEAPPQQKPPPIHRFWKIGIGLAAILTLGLFLPKVFETFSPDSAAPKPYIVTKENFSLAQLVQQVMPLDQHVNDPEALKAWLDSQGAPVSNSVPEIFQQAIAKGCKVFQTSEGGTISLACFEVDGKMLHMFVFDEKARSLMEHPSRQWWREGEWNMMTLENGPQLIALATHADRAAIERML